MCCTAYKAGSEAQKICRCCDRRSWFQWKQKGDHKGMAGSCWSHQWTGKNSKSSTILANEGCRLQRLAAKAQEPATSTNKAMKSFQIKHRPLLIQTGKQALKSLTLRETNLHLTLLCQRFQQRPAETRTHRASKGDSQRKMRTEWRINKSSKKNITHRYQYRYPIFMKLETKKAQGMCHQTCLSCRPPHLQ